MFLCPHPPRVQKLSHIAVAFGLLLAVTVVVGCSKSPSDVETRAKIAANETISAEGEQGRETTGTTEDRTQSNGQLNSIPGANHDQFDAFLKPILDQTQADEQTWQSEVIADQAAQTLKSIGMLLEHPDQITVDAFNELATDSCHVTALRPADNELAIVFDDEALTITRGSPKRGEASVGRAALRDAILALSHRQRVDCPIRTKFKLFRVRQPNEGEPPADVVTEAYFQSRGQAISGAGNHQQNLTWVCGWNRTEDALRLVSIRADRFEAITTKHARPFADLTDVVLGDERSYREQMTLGVDHWRGRLEANYGVDPNGNQGISIADINGDGLDDLYVCQQGGLPNRMYFQQADGTLRDVSKASGVDWMETCRSALFVDLDNDGDQDLVMAQGWYLMIMFNDGSGRFDVVFEKRSSANLYSTTASDYDHDGDLDLFICGRNPAREQDQSEGILGTPIPYHDANNGGPNILLRNDGADGFRDVTVEVGLDQNNRRYSYAASWEDFDDDGDQDLYVANDFGRNNLYRNELDEDGVRRFRDVAGELGVEDISAGMSVTWGDYNHDGRMDLYVSNMFSSAGNRVAYQRQFRASSGSRAQFQRHARGNSLFQQTDDGFEDVSVEAGVTMGRWAWGSTFVDINNDSWEDLYVTNGFITTEDTGDL